MTAEELWNEGAAALRNQLAPATWAAWFHGVAPLSHGDGTLVLSVPSSLAAERIRSSYSGMLVDAIRDRTGESVQFDLVVETSPRVATLVEPTREV
ncbi:MAG: DnaA N-terminal domain-containing protein, partial [Gaiellaceae bacterium]